MLEFGRPDLGGVAMANGMGVDAERVNSTDDFCIAFSRGLAERSPYVIEVLL